MKLRYKILSVIGVIVVLGGLALAFAMSHNSPCSPAPPLPAGATPMKAIVHRCYGSPDVIRYEDLPRPAPADNEILVKVQAASVNPLDWHYLEGTPYMLRIEAGFGKPDDPRLGVDFSGTVEAVGKSISRFKPGDEVFGGKFGALAQYIVVREERAVALKPASVTHEQAAAVAIAGVTALQALRDNGHIHAGQNVLVNGASGGVGTFAVQIAKSFGANVTGVCSTHNVDLVRSLGADQVIDYTKENFTKGNERYDVILDNVGTGHSLSEYKKVMVPEGKYVLIGGGGVADQGLLGGLARALWAPIVSKFGKQHMGMMMADPSTKDLTMLGEMTQEGKLKPVIDRTYKLEEVPQALAYLEQGHARG